LRSRPPRHNQRTHAAQSVAKMLSLHIPALVPAGQQEIDISFTVQTAAVLGVGFLYQGSANRLMTEMLLAEIGAAAARACSTLTRDRRRCTGRRPMSDREVDRESYALAAGLALGLVMLGRCGSAAGLADLKVENRLAEYIAGGKDTARTGRSAASARSAAKCSTISEGDTINVDVTAPAATMALALMYLKSNDAAVAAR
jgi:anaphase-promoting complex subunit 1